MSKIKVKGKRNIYDLVMNEDGVFELESQEHNENQIEIQENPLANKMEWVAYYRANPDVFVEDYFNVKLHTFQKYVIWDMMQVLSYDFIGTRGIGKTFLIAVGACTKCTLWPGSRVVVAANQKNQAEIIMTDKITKELTVSSPFLRLEAKYSGKDWYDKMNSTIEFKNSSWMVATVSGDGGRGKRASVLVVDEHRLISEDNLTTVLEPMMNYVRPLPFLKTPPFLKGGSRYEEGKKLREKPTIIKLSSSYYKSNWMYSDYMNHIKNMAMGDTKYSAICLPYSVPLKEGILPPERVVMAKQNPQTTEESFAMEYGTIFPGANEGAYFGFDEFQKCRSVRQVFIPPTVTQYFEWKEKKGKKNPLVDFPEPMSTEIRVISVDVARKEGDQNDNSVFSLMRLIPNGSFFMREFVYMEVYNGLHFQDQAVRIKQLFNDFEGTYCIIDALGLGHGLLDFLTIPLYDSERGVEYEPWNFFNDELATDQRSIPRESPRIIYPIKATDSLNSQMNIELKSAIQDKRTRFPIPYLEASENLMGKSKFKKMSMEDRRWALNPFFETDVLQTETTNLIMTIRGSKIFLKEQGNARKDRFSSILYANHLAGLLEKDILKQRGVGEDTLQAIYKINEKTMEKKRRVQNGKSRKQVKSIAIPRKNW